MCGQLKNVHLEKYSGLFTAYYMTLSDFFDKINSNVWSESSKHSFATLGVIHNRAIKLIEDSVLSPSIPWSIVKHPPSLPVL